MSAAIDDPETTDEARTTEPAPPREIELKLVASPDALDRIRHAPVVRQYAGAKGTTERLVAIYYDTQDRLLQRNGLSLRVRRNGRRHIQTLKGAPTDDPFTRAEWETRLDGVAPDLDRLPRAQIGPPFDTLSAAALDPIFKTDVRREERIIEWPDAVIALAFDEGRIEAGGRSEPLAEIELELKSGEAAALYEIALALLDVAPLRIGAVSKAERGYALAFDLPPTTAKAVPLGLRAQDTVNEALAGFLRGCQRHLMANIAAAERGYDPEGVHQMRVALRRLRAVISVVRGDIPAPSLAALGDSARQLARILGEARNWDVFLTETLAAADAADLPEGGVGAVRCAAERLRAKAYAAVRDALASQDANRFLLSLGLLIERQGWRADACDTSMAFIDGPVSVLAERALSRIRRKVLAKGRHFSELPAGARHRLRLVLKKLRYTTEFFLPLYAERRSARTYLRQLTRLQDALGADNDVTTTRPLLRDIEQGPLSLDLRRGIDAIIQWQSRRQDDAARELSQCWRSFRRTPPFWRDEG